MAALSVYINTTAEAAFEVSGDEEGYEGTDDQHEYFSSRYNEKRDWVIVRVFRTVANINFPRECVCSSAELQKADKGHICLCAQPLYRIVL